MKNGLQSFKNIIGHLELLFGGRKAFVVYNKIDLEIDLVPGILLSIDEFPNNMLNLKSPIHCERYGVMKRINKRDQHIPKQDGDLIWRNSSCGFEKCIFDIAQRNSSQLYVMTACRLLKWALRKVASNANNQLRSVLKSYHLKNLCLYCILFLTLPSEQNNLSSVREATGYFIEFIRISLEAKYLPYFFHGNPYLHNMFPGCAFGNEKNDVQHVCYKQCGDIYSCTVRIWGPQADITRSVPGKETARLQENQTLCSAFTSSINVGFFYVSYVFYVSALCTYR